jgi:PRTRC genetic system protein C
MPTKYVYLTGGREVEFVDEQDAYKPEDIKSHWAQTFPELSAATWDTKTGDDGVKVVTFAKKVGTKGLTHPIITLLLSIPPARVPAIDLLHQFYGEASATMEQIIARGPEIEQAFDQADALARRSNEALDRCLRLKPVSAPKVPLGF